MPVPAVGRRLLAYIIDVALLAVLVQIGHLALSALVLEGERPDWLTSGWQIWLFVLSTVSLPVYLYFAVLESGPHQATLGKRLLRIRVGRAGGGRVGFGQAMVRTVVKLLPWEVAHATMLLPVPIFDAGADAAMRPGFMVSTLLCGAWLAAVLLTPKGQGVHDLIAVTVVEVGVEVGDEAETAA